MHTRVTQSLRAGGRTRAGARGTALGGRFIVIGLRSIRIAPALEVLVLLHGKPLHVLGGLAFVLALQRARKVHNTINDVVGHVGVGLVREALQLGLGGGHQHQQLHGDGSDLQQVLIQLGHAVPDQSETQFIQVLQFVALAGLVVLGVRGDEHVGGIKSGLARAPELLLEIVFGWTKIVGFQLEKVLFERPPVREPTLFDDEQKYGHDFGLALGLARAALHVLVALVAELG